MRAISIMIMLKISKGNKVLRKKYPKKNNIRTRDIEVIKPKVKSQNRYPD